MKTLLTIFSLMAGILATSLSASATDTLITTSGIKYIQLSQGTGERPVANQKVKIVYSRKSATGEIVESNELSNLLNLN